MRRQRSDAHMTHSSWRRVAWHEAGQESHLVRLGQHRRRSRNLRRAKGTGDLPSQATIGVSGLWRRDRSAGIHWLDGRIRRPGELSHTPGRTVDEHRTGCSFTRWHQYLHYSFNAGS